jgi:hypothetical protein
MPQQEVFFEQIDGDRRIEACPELRFCLRLKIISITEASYGNHT